MIRVYIACPYTKGDVAVNVKNCMDAATKIIDLGMAPFAPLLFHFMHMAHPQTYETWMAIDLEWLEQCDAVLRLPGSSTGANREVRWARSMKIPVFMSFQELENYF